MSSATEERRMFSTQRPFEAYLWDIHKNGLKVLEFTQGKDVGDLERDGLLRSAVERCFTIIGEAVLQARMYYPDQPAQIEHADKIVALHELLVEDHRSNRAEALWSATESDLPRLIAEVTVLLDEWHQG